MVEDTSATKVHVVVFPNAALESKLFNDAKWVLDVQMAKCVKTACVVQCRFVKQMVELPCQFVAWEMLVRSDIFAKEEAVVPNRWHFAQMVDVPLKNVSVDLIVPQILDALLLEAVVPSA